VGATPVPGLEIPGRCAQEWRLKPLVSVVIVSWNTRELLRACLATVGERLAELSHETIVVDNASSDGSADMVETAFPGARLIRTGENLGFGKGANLGMAAAEGRFFLLLNSDTELVDDSAARLAQALEARPEVGVIAPRITLEDGRLQASARRFPSLRLLLLSELWLHRLLPREKAGRVLLGQYWGHGEERAVDWLVGACLMVRREVFEQTGGFDPAIFMYGEEVEWCHRIRERGWQVLFSPLGQVRHLNHRSADILLGTTGRIDQCLIAEDRLVTRWEGRVAGALAPAVRVAGALLRLAAFGLRRVVKDDEYGRGVRWEARVVLAHYLRRMRS
jgi:N-acetylglucosaminyl-diphospho-decaprenol L-rhamnosyltransferase